MALVPESVARLVRAGHEVRVEAGAGVEAGHPDEAYAAAGASSFALGDVNGDGRLDVVTSGREATSSVAVLLNSPLPP